MLEFFNILQAYNRGAAGAVMDNLAHDTRPPLTHLEFMTFKVTLPNGMLVTNPEQFTDEREEYETELLEDTTTS